MPGYQVEVILTDEEHRQRTAMFGVTLDSADESTVMGEALRLISAAYAQREPRPPETKEAGEITEPRKHPRHGQTRLVKAVVMESLMYPTAKTAAGTVVIKAYQTGFSKGYELACSLFFEDYEPKGSQALIDQRSEAISELLDLRSQADGCGRLPYPRDAHGMPTPTLATQCDCFEKLIADFKAHWGVDYECTSMVIGTAPATEKVMFPFSLRFRTTMQSATHRELIFEPTHCCLCGTRLVPEQPAESADPAPIDPTDH